ncbi:MAG: EAL domain-containing protein, partial [Thiohalospira sp.]
STEAFYRTAIAEVMSCPLKTIPLDATIDEAAMRFREERVRHFVAIGDGGRLAGILSQTDVTLGHSIDHYLTLRPVTTAIRSGIPRLDADLLLHEGVDEMRRMQGDAAIVDFPDGQRGIITERDLVRLVAEHCHTGTVGDFASVPLRTMPADESLLSARNLLEREGIRHLGVVDAQDDLTGILAISDILQILQNDYLQKLTETLRERDEQLIRSRRDLQLAKRVINSAHNAIVIANRSGAIEFANPAFAQLTGHDPEALIGQPVVETLVRDDGERTRLREQLDQREYWEGELTGLHASGDRLLLWASVEFRVCTESEEAQYIINLDDISERRALEERTRYLAYYDPLTGLPNRTLFLDRLEHAIQSDQRHQRRGALLFMDLDNFKTLNDVRGHEAGDELLRQIAGRLGANLRDEDTVARFGGDEFVVLLPELDGRREDALQAALGVADKLRLAVSEPVDLGGFSHQVGLSIGITAFPRGGDTAEELLKEADTAMYRAKESGRNAVRCFEAAMQAELESRLALEQDLRGALANDQFALFLQPQYGRDGQPVGAEVLLRWEHPERGTLNPGEFITLAEESGLIVAIGEWVLTETCRLQARLAERGEDQSIAVNISLRQFQEPDFVQRVLAIIKQTGADPERLVLELTENVVLHDLDQTKARMDQLRAHGIRFSVDDFGTGYSSLTYLSRLPLHEIKIDRAFVRDMDDDGQDNRQVGTILAIADHLSLRVVAEGVETCEQHDYLDGQACPAYQGYYFARPMPVREYLAGARH